MMGMEPPSSTTLLKDVDLDGTVDKRSEHEKHSLINLLVVNQSMDPANMTFDF